MYETDNIPALLIKAQWDDEASVWCASSDDIDGLAIEAETKEALIQRLQQVIPELWALNHSGARENARVNSRQSAPVTQQEFAPIELVISGHQRLQLAL